MASTPNTPQVDLAAIQAEVNGLNNDSLREELLKFKVRQKKQQKKNQGSENQKKYQMKQREKIKLMKAKAIELGIWDDINEEADRKADEELGTDRRLVKTPPKRLHAALAMQVQPF